MRKTISTLILTLGLLLGHSVAAQADTYYVCSNGGSDSNDGLTVDTPLATFSKAVGKFNTMPAGSAVLFCKGGDFISYGNRLGNAQCLSDATCELGSYAPTPINYFAPSPIIRAAIPTDPAGSPTPILNFQDGGASNHDEGYVVRDLNLIGYNNKGFGVFLFNDVDYVTVENVEVQRTGVAVYSAGANAPDVNDPNADWNNDFVTLRNSNIHDNSGAGWLGGGEDILLDGNRFINNGFGRKILDHNVYISNIKRGKLIGNYLYKSTNIDGICHGVSLVGHGVMEDLDISYNVVVEDKGKAAQTCWGIAVDPGYASEESFDRVTITHNRVVNVGNTAIGAASMTNFEIAFNDIVHDANFATVGVKVPDRTEDTVKSAFGVVHDNTFHFSGAASTAVLLGSSPYLKQYNNVVLP